MALLPFALALGAALLNILLCAVRINRKAVLGLNFVLWSVILFSFFALRSLGVDFSSTFSEISGTLATSLNTLKDSQISAQMLSSSVFLGFLRFDIFSFASCVLICILSLIFIFSSFFSSKIAAILPQNALLANSDSNKFTKNDSISFDKMALLGLCSFGLLGLCISSELILSLIFLEISSLSLYALIALGSVSQNATQGEKAKNIESAFKYFILSAIMGVFYLLGAALVFAECGSTQYSKIANLGTLGALGLGLIFCMLFFKVAIFGFYRWSVDVYFGAQTSLAGYLSSAFKLASFIALLRLVFLSGAAYLPRFGELFALLAIGSMFVGNFLCFKENSIKKILIAASIVHSGYILVNFAAFYGMDFSSLAFVGSADSMKSVFNGGLQNTSGVASALYPAVFYLCSYTIVVAFCFAILWAIFGARDVKINELRGLYRTHSLECLALVAACLSFIGFPFSVGFLGKFLLFESAFVGGLGFLAVFGIINTILSVYYYLRIIGGIYFTKVSQKSDLIPSASEIEYKKSKNIESNFAPFVATSHNSLNLSLRPSSAASKILALLAFLFIVCEGSGKFSLFSAIGLF